MKYKYLEGRLNWRPFFKRNDYMNYDEYQELANEQRDKNCVLLVQFESEMLFAGLSQKTVVKHMSNLDFYINHFLLYENVLLPEQGINEIDYFFNDWFRRKAMWSSPATVNETCTVLKKFYVFLQSKDIVTEEVINNLNDRIKTNKPEWVSHYSTSTSLIF